MKNFCKFLAAVMLAVFCVSASALAAEKEVSSIDAIDKGVADTGETHFTKTGLECRCIRP